MKRDDYSLDENIVIYFIENDFQDYLIENQHKFLDRHKPEISIPAIISDLCYYIHNKDMFIITPLAYGWITIHSDLRDYFPEFQDYQVFDENPH